MAQVVESTIKYGIIGVGMMGREHLINLYHLRDRGIAVVCIVDPHPPSQQSALDLACSFDWPIRVFSGHKELLDSGLCDVLIVSTPNMTHYQILMDIISHPKPHHVLVEKPLCTTVLHCKQVVEAARKRPEIMVQVGLEYRYMPPVAMLIEIVKGGKVGPVRMVAIREHRFPFLVKVNNWNRFNANTGGTLVEKCCHFFDLMRLFTGANPIRVMASGAMNVNHKDEVYDGKVGVAALDLRSASFHLSQYIETSSSYQNTKTLLHFYDPMVIIVPPSKMAADGMVGVSVLVDRYYPASKKIIMVRGCFDDTKGAVLVRNLAAKDPSALGLDSYYKQYYLCLAAAAATIKWTETEKGVIITNHSLLVTFNGSFDHVNIDASSVQNLELIEPLHSNLLGTSNKKKSLFHVLKTTRTTGGTRLLRANLLQPLKDIETINARLDCLDELMRNEQLFFGLSQVLRKFPKETDRVLCHFCFKQKNVTNKVLDIDIAKRSQMMISSIILLKTSLDALPLLSTVIKDAKSFLLRNIYKSICENGKYGLIRQRILQVIDEDVVHARVPFIARTQQCFAVKAGIDGLLDVARRTFCDTSEAIHKLANKYREDFKLPNLKLPFNNRQGFYFSISQKDVQGKLPGKFIQLNARNKSAAAECCVRTELCLEALNDAIREDVSMLTLLAEVLCLLDMIVNSFAHMISTKPVDRYIRPDFTENGPLAIDAGRHPILESIHSDFIPNNIFLSEASNMVIVMGPNMSGKSTYLQQVCLIVILAQIGCYIPARFSTIRVVDRIFTRMGAVDNLESNSSTFMTEMRETAFILQNASQRSLIVMDELGRATSSSDGFAIAWSCCENLLSLKAYTIFATHMENLSELATLYPNVKILHFHVDIRNNRLDFKFQLKDGPRHVPHYGLLLASVAGLPSSVIETAQIITSKITEKEARRMEVNQLQYYPIQMVYRVAQRLICLKYSNHDEDSVREALQTLKESYLGGRL